MTPRWHSVKYVRFFYNKILLHNNWSHVTKGYKDGQTTASCSWCNSCVNESKVIRKGPTGLRLPRITQNLVNQIPSATHDHANAFLKHYPQVAFNCVKSQIHLIAGKKTPKLTNKPRRDSKGSPGQRVVSVSARPRRALITPADWHGSAIPIAPQYRVCGGKLFAFDYVRLDSD